MELHFFKTSSDFYFYFFHFKFLSTFSLTDIEPALTLLLASPDLVPRAFPLKKNWRSHFCRKSPGDEVGHPHHSSSFAILEKRGKLGRVNFRKEFWDYFQNWPIADRRVPSNAARNNCGTHLGSSSLLVSKVGNRLFQRDIWPNFSCHLKEIFLLLIDLQREASGPKIARLRSKVAQGH